MRGWDGLCGVWGGSGEWGQWGDANAMALVPGAGQLGREEVVEATLAPGGTRRGQWLPTPVAATRVAGRARPVFSFFLLSLFFFFFFCRGGEGRALAIAAAPPPPSRGDGVCRCVSSQA